MPLTKVKSGGVSDSITLTSPDINAPDIDGGTIDNAVIGGSTAAAGSFTTITATGGSSSNWNTAYGWGDHSTQSYATQTYVGTEVSNLVDSSPAALDTLNELAAALGDDPNFATTVTNSIALKAPLASPSFTGNVLVGRTSSLSSQSGSVSANTVVSAHGPLSSHQTNTGILEYYNDETLLRSYGANAGSGELVFKVGGGGGSADSEAMRIDSAGRVGINTSSPSASKFSSTPDGVLNVSGNKPVVYLTEEDETDSNVWMGLSNEVGIIGNTGDGIAFRTGASTATERMRIGGASGYVGIGCSSTHGLTVSDIAGGGTDANMRRITIKSETHGVNSGFRFDSESANGTAVSSGYYFQPGNSDATTYLGLSANDISYQMVVTREGNVLVGKTANNLTSDGIVLRGSGELFVTRAGDVATFNRRGGTGDVVRIASNAATIGAIRSDADSIGIGSGDVGLLFYNAGDRIIPRNEVGTSNGALDLGYSTDRFKDFYLSGGVYLGGTGSANRLDDYEEGTFTPDVQNGTYTYSNRRGHYVKIGNMVYVHIGLRIATASSVTSAVGRITGLPFLSNNYGSYQEPHARIGVGGGFVTSNLGSHLSFYVDNNQTRLLARTSAVNADTPVASNAMWQNGTFIKLTVIYTVS